ncbi:MAG: hypothetical protein LBF88_02480 [Planctomycetaceae bacterium]|nr:hypothetical protein [Planctomycetaceae bacterium]
MTTENTVASLLEPWKRFGYPTYAQFDNSTVFTGPRPPNSIGHVIRLCLSLGVTPIFVPPHETGFQAGIERYNGLWQQGVWERFHFKNYQQLKEQSKKYVDAFRDKKWSSIRSAPNRYEVPNDFIFCCDHPLKGKIIFIRRTDNQGNTNVLGNTWNIDSLWTNRLIRVEIILTKHLVKFYRLRRRDPKDQPLIKTKKYKL